MNADRDAMAWTEPFYRAQFAWLSQDDDGEISEFHREIAAAAAGVVGPPPARILELGAGGGQVAAATADLGYEVIAIEREPAAAQAARDLARQPRAGSLEIVEGDFYEACPVGLFDLVTYWDGFGIGSDADQRRLLQRVHAWLRPGGSALLEVYTPWFWAACAGRTMVMGEAQRQYGFDSLGCRMLDRWWPITNPEQAVEQSLRCYSPADLELLLEGTGLALAGVEPGGTIDASTGAYRAEVTLLEAMVYVAKCVPAPPLARER